MAPTHRRKTSDERVQSKDPDSNPTHIRYQEEPAKGGTLQTTAGHTLCSTVLNFSSAAQYIHTAQKQTAKRIKFL